MRRGFASIGLDHPKDILNIGHVLRAAGCYDASLVAISGSRLNADRLARIKTDTQKAYKHLPVIQGPTLKELMPCGATPIAVEFISTAIPLNKFTHPESAFYVFGAEDRSLDESILSWCKDVIYVPTNQCMNLSATVNVVLYDRFYKRS